MTENKMTMERRLERLSDVYVETKYKMKVGAV